MLFNRPLHHCATRYHENASFTVTKIITKLFSIAHYVAQPLKIFYPRCKTRVRDLSDKKRLLAV